MIVVMLIVWIIHCYISYEIGQAGKNREIGETKSFWISLLLSPLLGILLVMISEKNLKPKEDKVMVKNKTTQLIENIIIIVLVLLMGITLYGFSGVLLK